MANFSGAGAEKHPKTKVRVKKKRIGPYELMGKIGQGSIATVYLARHLALPRVVALKVLKSNASQASIRRFIQEAEVMSRLDHPNIVKVYDAGQAGDVYFMAVEYLDGGTLSHAMRERKLSEKEVLILIRDLAKGLAHIHNRGVVHRDLKPANILLDSFGRAKICDFSIAKVTNNPIKLTKRGCAIGTSYYMPPEQVKGDLEAIDGRSDLYSLGVIMFQALTGRLPFSGSADEVFTKIQNESPPDPRDYDPNLSEETAAIVTKAMDKEQDNRYQRADEIVQDLEALLAEKPNHWAVTTVITLAVLSVILASLLVIREINLAQLKAAIALANTRADIEEHLAMGQWRQADELLQKALVIAPRNYQLRLLQFQYYQGMGNNEKAMEILGELNQWYPGRPRVLYHLARLALLQNQTKQVYVYLRQLHRATSLTPKQLFHLKGGHIFRSLTGQSQFQAIFSPSK